MVETDMVGSIKVFLKSLNLKFCSVCGYKFANIKDRQDLVCPACLAWYFKILNDRK